MCYPVQELYIYCLILIITLWSRSITVSIGHERKLIRRGVNLKKTDSSSPAPEPCPRPSCSTSSYAMVGWDFFISLYSVCGLHHLSRPYKLSVQSSLFRLLKEQNLSRHLDWCNQTFLFLLFCLFWLRRTACRILVPWPGLNPGLQQWKCWILTSGQPGNSPSRCFKGKATHGHSTASENVPPPLKQHANTEEEFLKFNHSFWWNTYPWSQLLLHQTLEEWNNNLFFTWSELSFCYMHLKEFRISDGESYKAPECIPRKFSFLKKL